MLAAFLLVRLAWVEILIHEVIDLVVFVGLGWTFRMRSFNVYFYQIPRLQALALDAAASPIDASAYSGGSALHAAAAGHFNGGTLGESAHLNRWEPGVPLPDAPEEILYPSKKGPKTVIVENPDTLDEEGNLISGEVLVAKAGGDVDSDDEPPDFSSRRRSKGERSGGNQRRDRSHGESDGHRHRSSRHRNDGSRTSGRAERRSQRQGRENGAISMVLPGTSHSGADSREVYRMDNDSGP